MTPKKASLYLIGGAFVMALIEKMSKPKDPGKATPILVPDTPATPINHVQVPGMAVQPVQAGPAQPIAPQGPHPLPLGATVQATPGKLYHVTVNVGFPLSMGASASSVQSQAQAHGFQNVSVSHNQMPAGWPGAVSGNYYVTGMYAGAPTALATSYVGGQVSIVEVWEG